MKTHHRPWKKLTDETLCRKAAAVATDVARRLTQMIGTGSEEKTSVRSPDTMAGESPPYASGRGAIGIVFLTSYLDSCMPGEGWDTSGHGILQSSAAALAQTPDPGLGLLTGISGTALAALYSSHHGTRYRRLLDTLDDHLIPATSRRLHALRQTTDGVPDYQCDLISGMTGVGAYLMSRVGQARALDQLKEILSWLVRLMTGCTNNIPHWHIPPRFLPEDRRALFPNGMLNCGLSHGIPGPLALLSIAAGDGIIVAGQAEAIRTVADWLLEHRADDQFGLNWPHAYSVAPEPKSPAPVACRAAWCYGSPGLARALWLAGDALKVDRYKSAALDAIGAVFRRPVADRGLDSPIFCHGLAGLLQITMRFANDAGSANLACHAMAVCRDILSLYDPQTTFGFTTPVVPGYADSPDNPSLLEGCAGIAITLLACGVDVEPSWDRIFLLS